MLAKMEKKMILVARWMDSVPLSAMDTLLEDMKDQIRDRSNRLQRVNTNLIAHFTSKCLGLGLRLGLDLPFYIFSVKFLFLVQLIFY